MATIKVNGGSIAYELLGSGPLFVWNAGGREPGVGQQGMLAELFSERYSVLVWDRRNSAGASDIYLSSAENPVHADADDLHAIVQKLDLGPACVGGGSAGCALSLMMAYRYPQDVSSILAVKPAAMNEAVLGHLADISWLSLATALEKYGMGAAIELSTDAFKRVAAGTAGQGEATTAWLARSIEANPNNKDRLLAMDPVHFAAMLRRWGDHTKKRGAMAGLTADEIQSIRVPAFIIAGDDPVHPRESAIWLAQQLPAAEMPTISEKGITTAEDWWGRLFPAIDEFLDRARTL